MQNHVGYSFQCFVSMILGECNFKDDICYPDDILLWDSTVNMEVVLDKTQKCAGNIAQTNLALSAKKCMFGVEEISYLGALTRKGKLCIGETRTKHLKEILRPTNLN